MAPHGTPASQAFSTLGRDANKGGAAKEYSNDEVVAFGGIPAPSADIRSSSRIRAQDNADLPQMERAMRMAQLRDSPGLFSSRLSFTSIPDSEVVNRANKLGVSLGSSPSAVASSVRELKIFEHHRAVQFISTRNFSSEDDPHALIVSKVSGLCEDLAEEDLLDIDDHTISLVQKKKLLETAVKKLLLIRQQ
jgi:hypothetical protein